MLRLLEEFPSCSLNIFEFLRVAQPLWPRYYSVSSSPRTHGAGASVLTEPRRADPARERGGGAAPRHARNAAVISAARPCNGGHRAAARKASSASPGVS